MLRNVEVRELLGGSRWAIEPSAFRALLRRLSLLSPEAAQTAVAAYGQRTPAGPQMIGNVALINASGPVMYRASWLSMVLGACVIADLQAQLRQALADPAVKTIVFRWDSPGGCVDMVQEFADEIFAARAQKPIMAVADTMIASAAYWLASQSTAIFASPSSQIGAIGVYCEHDDISGMLDQAGIKVTLISHGAHKVDGNPYEPLSDGARAKLQADVDQIGAAFDAAVARGRKVQRSTVLSTFGQGQVFRGTEAIARGMADRGGTLDDAMGSLVRGRIAGANAHLLATVGMSPLERYLADLATLVEDIRDSIESP